MDTVVMGVAAVWLLLWGKSSFSALGAIRVEVIIKKINRRKTISVIPYMANETLILFLVVIAIMTLFGNRLVQEVHKLSRVRLQLVNHFFDSCHQYVIGKISNDTHYQSGYSGNQCHIYTG